MHIERDLERIPSGRFFGKSLSKLSDDDVAALFGDWSKSEYLKNHAFYPLIQSEVALRQASVEATRRKRISEGKVEAKCSKCNRLSWVSAKAWAGEGIASKPKCSCGGMVYAKDQVSMITKIGQNF